MHLLLIIENIESFIKPFCPQFAIHQDGVVKLIVQVQLILSPVQL